MTSRSNPKKRGRKTKFTEEVKRVAEVLLKQGLTQEVVCQALNISERSFTRWKKQHPEFCLAVDGWKKEADEKVEKALYHRAIGYNCKDTKFATYEGQITDKEEYIKHYPPDTKAIELWLTNRKPRDWKVKAEVNVNQVLVKRTRKLFDGSVEPDEE